MTFCLSLALAAIYSAERKRLGILVNDLRMIIFDFGLILKDMLFKDFLFLAMAAILSVVAEPFGQFWRRAL